MCVRGDGRVRQLRLYRQGERPSHTFCLTPDRGACCTHLERSSRHMPAAHTGYHALPTAAERALNLMVSKYSRNQADNETRYPPPLHALLQQQPRPASPHTRDALLRDFLSHSFAPPHSFIPPWSSFCQSARRDANLSPKPGQSALTLYANASPLARLTHSFCAPHHHHHLLLHSFIYFFHLLL